MRQTLCLLALLSAATLVRAESHLTRLDPLGPHAVGLRVVEQYDATRSYKGVIDIVTGLPTTGERARPVQTWIWYPAAATTAPAMRAEDYLRRGASDDDFSPPPAERAQLAERFVRERVARLSPDRRQAELAAPMLAHADATPSAGPFPVVIYAPSFGAWAFENADLCEYLASQGYVVIASPSVGPAGREMTDTLEGAEAQAADIAFLIGYARSLPQADIHRLAVAGFSWGGLANVLAAAKDSRIQALVSMDGSVRYWPALLKEAPYATPARVTAPMLYLAARPREIEELAPGLDKDTSFLNRMVHADVYRLTLHPFEHSNFSGFFGQRLLTDGEYGDYDARELSTAHAWMETYVSRFLDAYLKQDATARAFLQQPVEKSGAPAHMLALRTTPAQRPAATRGTFAAALAAQGFGQALQVYQAFKAKDPDFEIPESDLNLWGYALMGKDTPADRAAAVALLKLAADLHPMSGNAFDSLGEAYAKNGEKALAIAAYRRSLALDPKNANAVAQLSALGAKP